MVDMLSSQFQEHLELRKNLGSLIAENHRLYPRPSTSNRGRPSLLETASSIEDKNDVLRDKIRSTEVSNSIGRGEREPTANRFG